MNETPKIKDLFSGFEDLMVTQFAVVIRGYFSNFLGSGF